MKGVGKPHVPGHLLHHHAGLLQPLGREVHLEPEEILIGALVVVTPKQAAEIGVIDMALARNLLQRPQPQAMPLVYSSSACAYNTLLQQDPNVRALKESDAYPAMAERGYGWEKLISEQFCQEYWHERGMKTAIARFHNVYGPHGTWDGGREKAPAALCRKVIEAIDTGKKDIAIWGNGEQTRSFMYIDDCVHGIDKITHSDELIATPINLGSSEMVSINDLLTKIEKIAGAQMDRKYNLHAPQGVAGRNSDNTFIKKVLKWEPNTKLDKGLAATYTWITEQYHDRKAGKRVGIG